MRSDRVFFSLTAVVIILMLSAWTPGPQAPTAGGTENQWPPGELGTALRLGVAGNYPDGTFQPNKPVTRAQFVEMLVNASGIKPYYKSQPTFKDVGRQNWAYPWVEAAVSSGIVLAKGDNPHFFRPDQTITRQEAAGLAGRLTTTEGLTGIPAPANGTTNWLGIFLEPPGANFKPEGTLTMAQACVVALRLKEQILAAQAARERQWISGAQSRAGYVTMCRGSTNINPYFDNLSEMALIGHPEYLGGIKKYLEWALSALNYPDIWHLNGTIYNLCLVDGVAQPVYSYDSADSYAATLLSLAAAYHYSSGDATFIREHLPELSTVAQVITTLQDKDGLIRAKPNLPFKYLMDNCESYRGLEDWASLLASLGLKTRSKLYGTKADLIKDGILRRLWDENTGTFAWATDNTERKYLLSRNHSYPGIFAQVYPVVFGVIPRTDAKAVLAYQTLNSDLPAWPELKVGNPFPWTILGYAAVKMGDLSRANRFLENIRSTYILRGRKYPWSNFASAYYVRACDALRASISEKP